jgi:thioredoxin reductase
MAYPTANWLEDTAIAAQHEADGFAITLKAGQRMVGRRIIMALGVKDTLPNVPGIQERWGQSVFHCPYCHGYEIEGPLGVVATGPASLNQALLLSDWGPVTFFLNREFLPDADQRLRLEARGVTIESAILTEIRGHADIALGDGREIALSGLFIMPKVRPNSSLFADLGCAVDEGPQGSFIRTDGVKETTVAGVFACGDAARSTHSISLAVGDGALAGQSTHRSLVFS